MCFRLYFHGISQFPIVFPIEIGIARVFPWYFSSHRFCPSKSSSSDIGKGDETSLSGTFAVGASHHHPDMASDQWL